LARGDAGPQPVSEEAELLAFLLSLASIGFAAHFAPRLPPLEEINQTLERGAGDDGFIMLTWRPFRIQEMEYKELEEAFGELKRKGKWNGAKP
jgi:hypothetical protein